MHLDEKLVIRKFIIYGVSYDAVQSIVKTFSQNFLERIGASHDLFFISNSLPALLSAIFLIPSIGILRRFKNTRDGAFFLFVISRFWIILFVLVPFFSSDAQGLVFTLALSLYLMPDASGSSAMQHNISMLFESKIRSKVISKRQRAAIPFTLLIVLSLGLLFNFFVDDKEALKRVYQLVFASSLILVFFELRALKSLPSPQSSDLHIPFISTFKEMLKDKNYLRFSLAALVFYFSWQLGWPLFSIWQIKYLGATETWSAVISLFGSLAMFPAYSFWSKQSIKHGISKPLIFSLLGMAINPFLIGSANNLVVFALIQLVTGFFTAGVFHLFLSALLHVSPSHEKGTLYLAVFNMFVLISQVLSQELGHLIFALTDIKTSIFIDGFLRLGAVGMMALSLRKVKSLALPHRESN